MLTPNLILIVVFKMGKNEQLEKLFEAFYFGEKGSVSDYMKYLIY